MRELDILTDDELLAATRACADEERAVTVRLLKHIEEVDRRKLYLKKGYPSLYEFVRGWLGISESSAYRRVASMQLIRDVPSMERKLKSGEMPLTTAAKIQTSFKKESIEKRTEMANACLGKSLREVERTIAAEQPEEKKEFTRWLSGDEVRLTIHMNKLSFIALNELKALRSHAPTGKTYGGVIGDLTQLGHKAWNPEKRAAPPALASQRKNKGRRIPTATRIAVWKRDESKCAYIDRESGQRCASRYYVQIDHIQPVALGGSNELENLRLHCGKHNRYRAEQTFGPRPKQPSSP